MLYEVITNDETMIPALLEYGIEPLDVYGYGFYGCSYNFV